MQRRHFLSTTRSLVLMGVGGLALWSAPTQAQPHFTVTAEQLQQVLGQRFPRRYPVAGLINVDLEMPVLRMLAAQNRVAADMMVQASGPALNRKQTGTFEVDFALRYEPSDRTLRATQLRFRRFNLPGLTASGAELLNTFGPNLAEQSFQEVVLHQLKPQDLAMADGLGLQPGSITVTDVGLVIGFVAKVP
jgi:hypothetical protein